MKGRLRGLYAITDASLKGPGIASQVQRAIDGGARVIQYRDKSTDRTLRRTEAAALLTVCRAAGIPLLINDDVALASQIGADGVHIGRDDGTLVAARAQLGPGAIVGVSCYNRLELARQALAEGADYVAFGRFFASGSKPEAVQADVALLRQARRELRCPIVAIGGISADNGRALIEAGADMLAVIRGIFAAEDVTKAAQSIQMLFQPEMEKAP
jgi:thiamine-phosphate pyrophosphorylase